MFHLPTSQPPLKAEPDRTVILRKPIEFSGWESVHPKKCHSSNWLPHSSLKAAFFRIANLAAVRRKPNHAAYLKRFSVSLSTSFASSKISILILSKSVRKSTLKWMKSFFGYANKVWQFLRGPTERLSNSQFNIDVVESLAGDPIERPVCWFCCFQNLKFKGVSFVSVECRE